MSKVSHLPKSVPSKELPFKIKIKGSATGHLYEADFTVVVPGGREMGRIGLELSRLNEGIPYESLDQSTANLHNAIAFLKVLLKEAPPWFRNSSTDEAEEGMDYGLDTVDINVPITIFREADKKVKEWYKSLKGQPKSDNEVN